MGTLAPWADCRDSGRCSDLETLPRLQLGLASHPRVLQRGLGSCHCFKHSDHALLCSVACYGSLSPLGYSPNSLARPTKPLMSWLQPQLPPCPLCWYPQDARWNILPVSTCLRPFMLRYLLERLCASYYQRLISIFKETAEATSSSPTAKVGAPPLAKPQHTAHHPAWHQSAPSSASRGQGPCGPLLSLPSGLEFIPECRRNQYLLNACNYLIGASKRIPSSSY